MISVKESYNEETKCLETSLAISQSAEDIGEFAHTYEQATLNVLQVCL